MPYRAALLALIFAAPALGQTGAPAEERTPTTIDAQRIEGVADIEVTARGNAEIRKDDVIIFGEVLRFNRELGRAQGEGGVRLQSGNNRFYGPRLEYNTLDDTGVFESPQYLLQRDRTARGNAERIEFLGRSRYRMTNANYTTCQPGQEDWRLEAEEIELDFEQEEGTADSPRLRFFDTTILASPWATFPLGDRRRSGLLTPYYAQTSTRGFEFGLPYYWNIAPELDATFTPVVMAKRGYQLKNELRYLDRTFNGELRFEYLPDDREFGTSREGISFQHTHRFGSNTTALIDYNRVSDDLYFTDLASTVKQLSVGNLPQDASITHGGTWGRRTPYSLQARVQTFQTLQDPLAPIVPPYHRVPQLNFGVSYNDIAGVVDASLPAEYVRFSHVTLVEGDRNLLNPTLAAPFLAPGWFVTPKVGTHYAGYQLTRAALGQPEAPQVTIPWASLDAGLVFERGSGLFGAGSTQTLEPRLFYVYIPYVNQDQIPIFDTALADFNYAQLFTENRFVGGDRFGDANQATLALTSRFLQADGQEAMRATIAQRYYFANERVGLTPTSELRTSTDSDVLASIGGRVGRRWAYDATAQFNRHEQQAEKYSIALRYSPEMAKVLNLSYRYNREALDQVDISGQWPIAAGWYAVGRYNYSFLDKRLLEGLAGFEYNAGCWVFRAVALQVQAAANVSSTAFVFQLEFNGIGAIGTDEAVEILKRNVPGYSVTNPANSQLAPPTARSRLPFDSVF